MRQAITAKESPDVFFHTLADQLHGQGIDAGVNRDSLTIMTFGGRNKDFLNAFRRLGWQIIDKKAGPFSGYTALRADGTYRLHIQNGRGAYLVVLV